MTKRRSERDVNEAGFTFAAADPVVGTRYADPAVAEWAKRNAPRKAIKRPVKRDFWSIAGDALAATLESTIGRFL